MSWSSIILSTSALIYAVRIVPKINNCNEQDTEMVCVVAFNSDLLWIDMQAGMVT